MSKTFSLVKKNHWILLIIFFPLFFFFLEKPQETSCLKNVKLNDRILFQHNCDAHSIVSSSKDFTHYLFFWENNPWKGRPLHIIVGTIGSSILSPLKYPINALIEKLDMNIKKSSFKERSNIYLSFFIFQILLLILFMKVIFSFYQFDLSKTQEFLITLTFLLSPLLYSIFWTFHSKFIIFIIPILGICSYFIGFHLKNYSKKTQILISIFLGCTVLFYQFSIIILPMLLIGSIRGNSFKLKNLLLIFTLFLLPFFLWNALNVFVIKTNIFYEYKTFGHFSWFLDLYKSENPFRVITLKIFEFFMFLKYLRFDFLVPLLLLIFIFFKLKKSNFVEVKELLISIAFYFIFHTGFVFLLDYYTEPRFMNSLISILIFLIFFLTLKFFKETFYYVSGFLIVWNLIINIYFPFYDR